MDVVQVLPVIVRYMDRYREDLEVELPLVESLHRIFSLPLKCWSCAIKAHDGFKASSRLSPVEEEAARQTSSHVARTVALNVDAVYSAVCAQAHRRAQHYKYLRSGAENGMLPLMPFLSEGVFESACDSCVNALLVLVGAQSTEIVLLRTVFAVLLSIVSLTGDGRYLRCICEALSTRLRTPIMSSPAPSEQSPQHLQIMSNEIAEEQALPMLTQNLHEIEFAAQMESETLFVGNTDSFQRNRARIGDLTVDTTVLGCSLDASDNTCLEQDGGGCDDDESDLDDWSEDEDVSVVEGYAFPDSNSH